MVFNKPLSARHTIGEEDLMTVLVPKAIRPSTALSDKTLALGKQLKIDVAAYDYVSENLMVVLSEVQSDLREKEFSFLTVPQKASQGDYADLRIKFPSGQDYIVLSKKGLTDLERLYNEENQMVSEIVWMNLTEKEIIRMGSAVVDAFLNKAELYLIEYVDPLSQEAAMVTYPVNFPVLDMIKDNPQLVNEAEMNLEITKREALEASLSRMFHEQKIEFDSPEPMTTITEEVQETVTMEPTTEAPSTEEITKPSHNFN